MPGRAAENLAQRPAQRLEHRPPAPVRRNDKIGPRALFGIGRLTGQNKGKFFRRHLRPGQNPGPLNEARRRDDEDGVAAPLPAGLEQQRDIQRDRRRAAQGRHQQKPLLRLPDNGMNDPLEPGQDRPVVGNQRAQRRAVDGAAAHRFGPDCADRADRRAAAGIDRVNGRVGVVDRDAEEAQIPGRRRLAHADGAGEADNAHQPAIMRSPSMRSPSMRSPATAWRTSSSTAGSTPNQARKPGLP